MTSTRVIGSSWKHDISEFHAWLYKIVEVLSDKPVVSSEDFCGISASFLDVSYDSSAQGNIRVAMNEDLEVEQVSDSLDQGCLLRRRRRRYPPG